MTNVCDKSSAVINFEVKLRGKFKDSKLYFATT